MRSIPSVLKDDEHVLLSALRSEVRGTKPSIIPMTLMFMIGHQHAKVISQFSDVGVFFDEKGQLHLVEGDAACEETEDFHFDGFDVLHVLKTLQDSDPSVAQKFEALIEYDYVGPNSQLDAA